MSSQKTNNNDSCRDLSGRRLSTLKEAKKIAEYLESEPQRLAAKSEAQKAKLEALERKLGIENPGSSASGSKPGDLPVLDKKRRFDDTEYLEQSREIVDNVKNAVSVALLKKRKKTKTDGNGNGAKKPEMEVKVAKPASAAIEARVEAPPAPEPALSAVGA